MSALRRCLQLLAAPRLIGKASSKAVQILPQTQSINTASFSARPAWKLGGSSALTFGCAAPPGVQSVGRHAAFASQSAKQPLRQGERLEEPWHDKIAHNLSGGDRHEIQTPIDELSEHVNISNEIEKELAKATDAQFVLRLVGDHIDQFGGPSIATAFAALVQHASNMSPDAIAREITQTPAFKSLCNQVESSSTFDAFTLMHTLRALTSLNVENPQLIEHVASRLSGLIENTPAKQLRRVVRGLCSSEHAVPDSLVQAVNARLSALKDDVDSEVKRDIEECIERMADWQNQNSLETHGSRDSVKSDPPEQSRDSTGAPQQPTSFSHA